MLNSSECCNSATKTWVNWKLGRSCAKPFSFIPMPMPVSSPRFSSFLAAKPRLANLLMPPIQSPCSRSKGHFTCHCMANTRLYVSGLSFVTREETLRQEFSKFGEVTDVKIMSYPDGKSRGFGFVTFAEEFQAKAAADGMDGKVINARIIQVEAAQPKRGPRQSSHPSSLLERGGGGGRGNSLRSGNGNRDSIGRVSLDSERKGSIFRPRKAGLEGSSFIKQGDASQSRSNDDKCGSSSFTSMGGREGSAIVFDSWDEFMGRIDCGGGATQIDLLHESNSRKDSEDVNQSGTLHVYSGEVKDFLSSIDSGSAQNKDNNSIDYGSAQNKENSSIDSTSAQNKEKKGIRSNTRSGGDGAKVGPISNNSRQTIARRNEPISGQPVNVKPKYTPPPLIHPRQDVLAAPNVVTIADPSWDEFLNQIESGEIKES